MKINWNKFRKEQLGYSGTENLAKIKANANEAWKKEQKEEANRKAAEAAAPQAAPVPQVNCNTPPPRRKGGKETQEYLNWAKVCKKPAEVTHRGGKRKTQRRKSMKRKTHKRR